MEQKYDELYHYGILGMKWGIRRYQNEDGSLTEAGRKRYQNSDYTLNEKGRKEYDKLSNKSKKLKATTDSRQVFLDRAYGDIQNQKFVSKTATGIKRMREIRKLKNMQKFTKDLESIQNADLNKLRKIEQKMHDLVTKPFSALTKDEKYQSAVKTGWYDLTFVEITQNEDWSDKKALSEYKKYLNNPDNYIEKWRNS